MRKIYGLASLVVLFALTSVITTTLAADTYKIKVTIVNQDDRPQPNIGVAIYNPSNVAVASGNTGSDGTWTSPGLPAGVSYRVHTNPAGAPVEQTVSNLSKDESVTLRIRTAGGIGLDITTLMALGGGGGAAAVVAAVVVLKKKGKAPAVEVTPQADILKCAVCRKDIQKGEEVRVGINYYCKTCAKHLYKE